VVELSAAANQPMPYLMAKTVKLTFDERLPLELPFTGRTDGTAYIECPMRLATSRDLVDA
jgi:hypothetical protein